jgi:hypothetical protein
MYACTYVCTYNVTYVCIRIYVYIYFCLYVPVYVHVFMSLSIRRPQMQCRQIRTSFKELSTRKDFEVKRSVSAGMMFVCVCV